MCMVRLSTWMVGSRESLCGVSRKDSSCVSGVDSERVLGLRSPGRGESMKLLGSCAIV
jgi:hypothetical protein